MLDCVWDARERCVLFDVGDGANALGFEVAEVAIAEGFLPDALSSEHYQHHFLPEPDHDLLQVVSKMIAAGITAEQYWSRVTSVLAQVLGLGSEIGRPQLTCALITCTTHYVSPTACFSLIVSGAGDRYPR